jgi:hypothetical protein
VDAPFALDQSAGAGLPQFAGLATLDRSLAGRHTEGA